MALSKISPLMIEALGTANSQTFLRGDGSWSESTLSSGLDLGNIVGNPFNVITLLLQASDIDFNNTTLAYDAGTI